MPLYEHVFLGRQDISAQQFEGLFETYQAIIKDNGGAIEKTESWGIKNLAYKIKKNRKAHFALMNINAPHEAVAEMERQMSISTDIIRFLTLRVDEHDEGPSAMMKRGDRDDRRGGRGGHRDNRDRDSGPRSRDHSGSRGRDERPAAAPPKPDTEVAPAKEAAGDKSSDDSKAEE
jgi:small subunit ribosomal protein S6